MDSKGRLSPTEHIRSTTEIQSVSHGLCEAINPKNPEAYLLPVIEENGVKLRLNIVDTPGYGDQVNNDRW